MKLRPMSVLEINQYISRQLKFDPILNNALIVGEISNFKRYNSGHIYFTLKDSDSKISCVMFRSAAIKLEYEPQEGEKTEVSGSIGVYEKDGKYQVYVTSLAPIGKGELYKAFLEQKSKLEKEGYFEKNAPIKSFPKSIGIVTSKTSAAVRDMITVLKRRNPKVKVIIYHASVQGQNAKYEISNGIDYFNEMNSVDTIIVGRGGGSLEELWAFNELMVLESIYASKIPVVSGVGHETDFTLTDFVADHRAATPTEAAELSVYPLERYIESTRMALSKLSFSITNKLQLSQLTLEKHNINYLCQLMKRKIEVEHTNIDSNINIIHNKMYRRLEHLKNALDTQGVKLNTLSPLNTLNRGYGIIEKNHDVIMDINQVDISDRIDIIIKNGIIRTEVISKEGKDFNEK